MKSAPIILILLALMLLFGTFLAATIGSFNFREAAFSLVLPAILIYSAIQIWRMQRRNEQK